jgi:hypothetical protein
MLAVSTVQKDNGEIIVIGPPEEYDLSVFI